MYNANIKGYLKYATKYQKYMLMEKLKNAFQER